MLWPNTHHTVGAVENCWQPSQLFSFTIDDSCEWCDGYVNLIKKTCRPSVWVGNACDIRCHGNLVWRQCVFISSQTYILTHRHLSATPPSTHAEIAHSLNNSEPNEHNFTQIILAQDTLSFSLYISVLRNESDAHSDSASKGCTNASFLQLQSSPHTQTQHCHCP